MAPLRSISELATIIERNTRIIEDGLEGSPTAQFSLALGAPPQIELPHSLETTRGELLETLDELHSRLLGPLGHLLRLLFPTPALIAIFQTLYEFDIASHVPLSPGDEISYEDLAKSCGLPEDNTRRIVQGAIAFRVFKEVTPDVSIRHNAISSALTVPQLKDMLGLFIDEQLSGCSKIVESIQRFPDSGEPGHSASVLAFREAKAVKENGINKEEISDPSKNIFDYLAEDEKRVARFRSAMGMSNKSLALRSSYFVDSLPWADKSQCPETIVDIGGSGGDLCHLVLRTHPHVKKAVVLDLPEVIADVEVPEDLKNRLEFASYNFFTEKVTHQADAYLFRHIFHDWSDQYGAKILKNLVPALKKGTKIWISEVVLPPLSETNHTKDQMQRVADIFMMAGFNGKERSKGGWEALLAAADKRFRIANITRPDGAHDSVIEVVFDA
ncbi:S-adenosyl-L-methionine-dependent methyltransferase [Annulohypoxylon maeteangense]|uniref:S-adenosyl-L-methionine-dependent methyltransferase n=1 Tax=Annulohypoxylon maeteangense TaxID=1927788 RepID=UPI002008787A|nr:S-adenosyl-L-methionine-dependent methyltransferase [Annulohypoxylon maeteangense]KAI0881999.1 S-adenosyl-L-methionine-dependent methyltransferase [Annulohypoxylon maeteangense]